MTHASAGHDCDPSGPAGDRAPDGTRSVVAMSSTTQRRRVLTAGVAALTLTIAGCSSGRPTTATSSSTATSTSPVQTSAPSTKTSPSATSSTSAVPSVDPLTGGRKNGNPVIAVKLENTAAAMPQRGLSAADLVFVEEVEGSLTRLMPIYQSSYPQRVEPVRSARSTDIDILSMFGHPLLVYSGVASQVRPKLTKAPIRLNSNGSRDKSRVAPHNVYFDVQAVAKQRGLSTSGDVGLRFAMSYAAVTNAAKQEKPDVRVGGDRFTFAYQGGRYLPSWNGRPYTDGATRVMADNVLVLATKAVPDSYKDPAGNPVYKTVSTGSGKLSLYRNGKQISGTWSRTATDKPFVLRDASGNQLRLAPGKTWILLQN